MCQQGVLYLNGVGKVFLKMWRFNKAVKILMSKKTYEYHRKKPKKQGRHTNHRVCLGKLVHNTKSSSN